VEVSPWFSVNGEQILWPSLQSLVKHSGFSGCEWDPDRSSYELLATFPVNSLGFPTPFKNSPEKLKSCQLRLSESPTVLDKCLISVGSL
jgi:hypothetical protein